MTTADTPVHTPDVRRWTGIAGITSALLILFEAFMHSIAGPRPELDDTAALVEWTVANRGITLVIVMTDTLLMAAILVFASGFRRIITRVRLDLQWVADVGFGAAVAWVGLTLTGRSLEAGAALDTVNLTPDPSSIRALTVGHILPFGAMGSVLLALMAFAGAYCILASRGLPRWTGWFALVTGILNLSVLITVFGGTSDTDPLSAAGLVVTGLATFPAMAWIVVVGVVTIRGDRHQDRMTDQQQRATP